MMNLKISDDGVIVSDTQGERDVVMAQLGVLVLHVLKLQSKDEAEFEGLKLQLMARLSQVKRDMVRFDWRLGENER